MKKIVALVLAMVMVLGLATVASAVEPTKTLEDVYMLDVNAAAGTAPTQVDLSFYKEDTIKYNATTGMREEENGTMAYWYDGTDAWLQVATLAEADKVIYADAAGKIVKMYLAAPVALLYSDATVVTNFGEDCGEFDLGDDFDEDATYYTVKGIPTYFLAYADEDGTAVMKVNGQFVTVTVIGAKTVVAHTPVIESEDGEIVKVYCGKCKCVAAEAANLMSVPVGADTTGLPNYWYWTAAVEAPAADSDKVESAETFDAGIAMYVGMSVMAAAGSAVVLKKKD